MRAFQIKEELINEIQEFNDNQFNIEESIEEAKLLLEQEMSINHLNDCTFEDNVWYLFSELHSDRRIINFNELRDILRFNKEIQTNEFVNVLKCWTASLLQTYTVTSVHNYVRGINIFFTLTKGLTVINTEEIVDDFNDLTETMKKDACLSALNLFDYYSDLKIQDQVVSLAHGLKKKYKIEANVRILPLSKDILVFSKIIDEYFITPLSDTEYFRWFPVWLWWKLTNIIPLRPSEFCDIKRDCLSENEGIYYIQLPRKKQQLNKRKIQVPDKIYIPHELYEKIDQYRQKTETFGKTETLISYLSIPHFMDNRYFSTTNHSKKLVPTKFTLGVFRGILNSFYENVVFGKYEIQMYDKRTEHKNLTFITQKIKPGDTRHLAFINLKRQGYHPVEIARLGGHTSLRSQEHYFNHIGKFVDLEILELITNTDLNSYQNKISNAEEKNKFSLGLSFVDKYVLRPSKTKTKIKMTDGYCTDPEQKCKVEDCWECDSWRITHEEFVQKKDILEEKIKNSQTYINEVVDNLKGLYQAIYSNIGYDEFYSAENPEIRRQLINYSKRVDEAISKYINLTKIKERIDSVGNKG